MLLSIIYFKIEHSIPAGTHPHELGFMGYPKITQANLSIFVYRLFHGVFTPLIMTSWVPTCMCVYSFTKFKIQDSLQFYVRRSIKVKGDPVNNTNAAVFCSISSFS